MDATRGIGAREILDNRTQDDERRTRTEPDDAVKDRLQPVVMHEREREHRDGRSCGRERDKPRLDETLRRPAGRKRTQHVAHRDDEHRNRDDRRVEHVRHVLDEDEENLRDAPDGGKSEDGEAHNRVPPRGREIAPGRTELQGIVGSADADEERRESRKRAKPEVNPEREIDAHRRIGPSRKPHREERCAGGTEHGKCHVPRVDFHEVFALDHLLHDTEFGRGENREEDAVKAEQAVSDPFGTSHITDNDSDNGGEHSHRRPGHHAALVEAAREITCRRHHENGRRENGDLEQHAAPPEGRAFERKGEPALEMDKKSHLDENTAKNKKQERNRARVFR